MASPSDMIGLVWDDDCLIQGMAFDPWECGEASEETVVSVSEKQLTDVTF